jgi:hypothetical protein
MNMIRTDYLCDNKYVIDKQDYVFYIL